MKWLLRALLARDEADAVVGDALEDLAQRTAAGHRPRWTTLWLNWQLMRALVAAVPTRAPRGLRACGFTIRDAARSIRRRPAHPMFVVAILTLGISAATVTFSIVDAVVLQPLPIEHSEELVSVRGQNAKGRINLTPQEFWAIHDHVEGFDSLATMMTWTGGKISAGGVESRGNVINATAELFRVLRVAPAMGRIWTPDEEAIAVSPLAIISDRIWRTRFGAAPDVIGRSIDLEGKPYQILGVMPPGAEFDEIGWSADAWIPRAPSRGGEPGRMRVYAIGRLRTGVSMEQVQAQAQSATASIAASQPSAYTDWRPSIGRWDQELMTGRGGADVGRWLLLALAVVGLVMLIACVNAANVMLTRSAERTQELAIRSSLGASRRSLTWSLLTESLMLSSVAAVFAVTISIWTSQVAKTAISALPVGGFVIGRLQSAGLNGRVLLAAIAAALLTGLLFGAVPAWQASRASVVSLLKGATVSASGARRRWRSALLTAEIACVAVLLVVATLFITTFVRVTSVNLGIDRAHLLTVSTVTNYQGTAQEVKEHFARVPGVAGVAASTFSSLPLVGAAFGGAWGATKLEPLGNVAGARVAEADVFRVTADYFAVAGMPFRQGSTWSSIDDPGFRPMVVDELAARRLVDGGSVVGLQVRATGLKDGLFTIVGVVPHVFARGPDSPDVATIYYPMRPNEKPSWVSFLVRTTVPPASLVPAMEAALAQIAVRDDSPGAGVNLPDNAFRRMTMARRFNAGLMSVLAFVVIAISTAGIYALMASVVAQQTREIGVRVALGATASDIRRRVFGHAARHVAVGLAAGLPLAWWLSRGFTAFFYNVSPADLSIYVIVAVVLTGVGLVAAFIPARRAARVDPIVSLRAS